MSLLSYLRRCFGIKEKAKVDATGNLMSGEAVMSMGHAIILPRTVINPNEMGRLRRDRDDEDERRKDDSQSKTIGYDWDSIYANGGYLSTDSSSDFSSSSDYSSNDNSSTSDFGGGDFGGGGSGDTY